jgi:hypothetical protein
MVGLEKTLADYFIEAIQKDYLITILITSYTKAKKVTENLPFGVGKTTLLFWLSYYLNREKGEPKEQTWNRVFDYMAYNPYAIATLLKPDSRRKNAVAWDDVQATAPAEQGVPRAIRKLANFLSTERPEVACLLMSAPNISMISAPLRKLVIFEIIVSERGQYEVQKIMYRKNYKDPLHDLAKLDYVDETKQDEPFDRLPDDIFERYRKWRATEKLRLYPELLNDLQLYVQLKEWNEDGTQPLPDQLSARVVKSAHKGYAIELPEEIGKKLYQQRVTFTRPKPVT